MKFTAKVFKQASVKEPSRDGKTYYNRVAFMQGTESKTFYVNEELMFNDIMNIPDFTPVTITVDIRPSADGKTYWDLVNVSPIESKQEEKQVEPASKQTK